jgi:glycerol-3-phosphate acyltransferase PlsX
MRAKKPNPPHIGIDIMGSDLAPSQIIDAVWELSKELQTDVRFTLFGTKEYQNFFTKRKSSHLSYFSTGLSIAMEDNPLWAIRRKKDSSLCQGIFSLQKKQIDAFVSAGNTGALLSAATMFLPPLPQIERPALLALLPTKKGYMAVLDVGANVSCQKKHLYQFALMGIAFQKARGIEKPSVGLLNIGSEEKKGTAEIRKAYQELLEKSKNSSAFSFVGNIEGRAAFEGTVDVLVTDGFTGNVFLKTAEGIASFILDRIKGPSQENEINSLCTDLQKNLLYSEYPGAILIGVDALIIKCHGYSSAEAFQNGIKGAISLCENQVLSTVIDTLSLL